MTSCKICGSQNTALQHLNDTELVLCQDCEATFLATIPPEQELAEYYEGNYRITAQDYVATEKRRFFRFPEQIKLISQLVQLKPPPASVLDIGCDKGYFLDEMRRYGYRVTGVEPSKMAHALASKTFKEYWGDRIALKKKLGRIYEDLTGIELSAVAAKK